MSFAQPAYLFLLLLLVPLAVWYWLKLRHGQPDLQISSVQAFEGAPRSYKYYLRHVPFVLRCLTLALLVVAIARPQSSNSFRNSSVEGIDIMLAIDISGSMLAEDLKPNRLEAAKSVAVEFIEKRPNDRIGLVVFASESFLQCPLTTDHKALISLLEGVQEGMLPDGTAIGLGLATSVSRLKDSETKSKIVILLTDGSNNAGEISPLTAAELARTFGIRAYTIGVGTHGLAPMPFRTNTGAIVYQNVEVNIDENTLRGIADLTGGTYFRATDTDNLRSIYREIDKLEKTRIHDEEFDRRKEEFHIFALTALVLLLLEILLRKTVLRRIP